MQDNYPQEFDEQYIDQAWSEMKKLLDKEMPVQPNRRAAGWLWLLAGFLLAALMGGGAYFLLQPVKNEAPPSSPPAPTAQLELPAGQQRAGEAGQKAAVAPEQNSGTGKEAPAGITRHDSAKQRRAGTTGRSMTTPWLPEAPALPDIPNGRGPEAEKGAGPAPAPKNPTSLSRETTGKARAWPQINSLPALPGKNLAVAETQKEQAAGLPYPVYRQPGLFRVAAEGSAFWLGHSAADGLGIGLAVEAHPRRSRLYARAGAFFRSYRPRLATESSVLRLENSFSKIPQPDGSLANSNSELASSTAVEAARYVQVPLVAGFQWRPRLAFEAGIQAGFLVSSTTASTWKLNNQAGSSSGPQQENNTIFETSKGPGAPLLNTASLDVIAGLAYRPSERTSLRLYWQYGLADVFVSARNEAYLRGLSLSFSYYLID